MTNMTRRAALTAAAAIPAAALLPASAARAAAHAATGPTQPKARGAKVGDLTVTALLAGTASREGDQQETFGMNVDAETFAEVSQKAFLPVDKSQFFFTPTLVRAGENVILFDTGLNSAGLMEAMSEAGATADEVTHVVITHMHGDHIGGLLTDGAPTFANAEHITGEAEMAHWSEAGGDSFEANVASLRDQFTLIGDGAELAPGITAMAMFGHTPGMMGYMLNSGDASLLITADMTNHYVWSLAYPDWEVRFDMDKAAAAETRRRVLGMLAAERMPMLGYHMPFPAMGFVEARDTGFHWTPESYQLML
ncbi:MBL fold metallo-hydrolase [Jannaschia ovalis]|uniref:MBL fold metallo-hydrolase n=1 Tax=Jannaschia ovalis TaxID=3038773 RepID=A0ABY8L9Y1_9RHOB|nr:MBL fold metallo-hydrolase [Jannaschia sp. GRR-S6-38]WGH78158.1 MBL fold metallo-hydrolase [Jannaschia sp. GRR-S6-38]